MSDQETQDPSTADTVPDTSEPAPVDTEAAPADDAAAGTEPAEPTRPPRKDRRADFKARQDAKLAQDSMARENRELKEHLQRVLASQEGLTSRLDRALPKPADPQDQAITTAKQKMTKALARMANDPSAFAEYQEALTEHADAVAEKRLQAAIPGLMQRFQSQIPQQRHPAVQALYAEHPWAQDHSELIAATMKTLERVQGRDMSDERVRVATMREAALMVGKQFGLITGNETRRAPFSPTGHPGPADQDPLKNVDMALVQRAADGMYADEQDPAKRRAMWLRDCGPYLKQTA